MERFYRRPGGEAIAALKALLPSPTMRGMGRDPDRPDVFRYMDCRAFLKDSYAHRKRTERGFSFGKFALRAGVARSHLSNVMGGRWLPTPSVAARFARGLGLPVEERECFLALVRYNRARGEEAEDALNALRWLHLNRRSRILSVDQVRTLQAKWHHTVVLQLSCLNGFRADARWISLRTAGKVSPAQSRASLRTLRRLGLIRTRGKRLLHTAGGSYRWEHEGDDSPVQPEGHTVWLRKEAAEQAKRGNPFGGSATIWVSLTRGDAERLHLEISRMAAASAVRMQSRGGPVERYAVLCDILPVTSRDAASERSGRPGPLRGPRRPAP